MNDPEVLKEDKTQDDHNKGHDSEHTYKTNGNDETSDEIGTDN